MSKPINAIENRKQELREKADNRREEFRQAKQKLKGNPELVEAVEALEGELDALREALNL